MTTERRPCGMCESCIWAHPSRCRWLTPRTDALTGTDDPRVGRTWRNEGDGRYVEVTPGTPHEEPGQPLFLPAPRELVEAQASDLPYLRQVAGNPPAIDQDEAPPPTGGLTNAELGKVIGARLRALAARRKETRS